MSEFEELRIGVSVKDDATEKLRKLRTEGEKFHTDTGHKVTEHLKSSTNASSRFATELRGLASTFGTFGKLPVFTGVGFAAIVTSIKIINDQIGSFAREILRVRDVARVAGLNPDHFKSYVGQLKLAGYTAEQAEQEIVGFFRTVEEAGRAGTPEFQRIWQESFNPEVTLGRINQMRQLIRSGEGGKAITMAVEEAKAIMAREISSGRGMQEARRQAEHWLRAIGLSMRALNINDISDFLGDPGKWERRIRAAEEFNLEYTKLERAIGELVGEVQLALMPAFKQLNEELSKSGGLFDWIKQEGETLRKIFAALLGDVKPILNPQHPLYRLLYGPAHEPEGPPTPWGDLPFDPRTGDPWIKERLNRQYGPESKTGWERFRDWWGTKDAMQGDVDANKEVLEEVKRLNDLLFEMEQKGTNKLGPTFHNAPQGGARGESNPIIMPWSERQPGGGSAAEARQFPQTGPRSFKATESTVYYTGPKGSMVGGRPGVQYTDPVTGKTYIDRTPPIGPAASGLPEEVPGIAFGYHNYPSHGRETLGGYYLVTPTSGPNAGKSYIFPHSDIGPGAGKGEKLDYNAPASAMVYGGYNPSGASHATYIGKMLPENIDIGLQSSADVLARRYELGAEHQAAIQADVDRANRPSGGPPWSTLGDTGGGGSFGGGGATSSYRPDYAGLPSIPNSLAAAEDYSRLGSGAFSDLFGDWADADTSSNRGTTQSSPWDFESNIERSYLDRALGSEDIEARGNLDVNVRGAPARVTVEGDGMFKGNTNLTQEVAL